MFLYNRPVNIEQPGLEVASIWDAGTAACSLTHHATLLVLEQGLRNCTDDSGGQPGRRLLESMCFSGVNQDAPLLPDLTGALPVETRYARLQMTLL